MRRPVISEANDDNGWATLSWGMIDVSPLLSRCGCARDGVAAAINESSPNVGHATIPPPCPPPYLLSGFARCGCCNGGLAAHSRSHGARRQRFYGCTSFWKRGAKVCPNNFVGEMEQIEKEVLATLEVDILRPAVVNEALRELLSALSPSRLDESRATLEAERDAARGECERLAAAIAQGGPLSALLDRLTTAQERADDAERRLRTVGTQRTATLNLDGLEKRVRAKLADWREALRRNVAEGRAVLRAILVGPLRFTPVADGRRRGYAFEGAIRLDRLLAGVVDLPTKLASPTGVVPEWSRQIPGEVPAAGAGKAA